LRNKKTISNPFRGVFDAKKETPQKMAKMLSRFSDIGEPHRLN